MNKEKTIDEAAMQLRNVMRFRRMSEKSIKSYVGWFFRFANWCYSNRLPTPETRISGFLSFIVDLFAFNFSLTPRLLIF